MATTVAANRSWSQIVTGVETPACSPDADSFAEEVPPVAQPGPMKPGTRGSRQSWCRGEFLMMAGHYGWIMSLDSIDHPDAGKHGGDIYIAKRDLGGKTFKKGDIVGFYLYADDQGLGAEACILIQEAAESDTGDEDGWAGGWSTGWADNEADGWTGGWDDWDHAAQKQKSWHFNEHSKTTGMNPYVTEFVPLIPVVPVTHSMNPHVAEFVPTAVSMNPCATEFVPAVNPGPPEREHAISSFNPAYLSDDSSDEVFSPAPRKVADSASGGSTSAGEELGAMSTDSGSDGDAEPMPASISFRPPPGLTLPPWRRGTRKVWGRLATSEEDTSSEPSGKDQSMRPWSRHAKKAGAEPAEPAAELTPA